MMNTYPENDYRNYLMHWGKGGESKNHKYVSRKMGKNGKWIYAYAKDSGKKSVRADRVWDDENKKWSDTKEPGKVSKFISNTKQSVVKNADKIKSVLARPFESADRKKKIRNAKSGVVERNKSAYSSVQSKVKKTTYSAERTKRIKAENATKKKDYIINAKNAKKSRKR